MRRTMMALLAGLLFLPALSAADKPAAPKEQLEALKKEVEKARQDAESAYTKAKTDKERKELDDKENKQIHACARRALELARKHPKDPVAVDALSWIIAGGLGYFTARAEIETAYDLLRKHYVASDKLQRVCGMATIYHYYSPKPEKLLRGMIEENPHHAMQGWARISLARVLRREAIMAKMVRDPKEAERLATFTNADIMKHYKNSDPDKLSKEAENLLEGVGSKYGDVKSARGTLGDQAKAMLFEMRYLVVGKIAPEIEGEDIDGKKFKLSDYRGKVVVLDFWGHW